MNLRSVLLLGKHYVGQTHKTIVRHCFLMVVLKITEYAVHARTCITLPQAKFITICTHQSIEELHTICFTSHAD